MDTQQFYVQFLILFVGHQCLKVVRALTGSAAILCPAVRVSDVTNKASLCGRSIRYVMTQRCWLLIGKEDSTQLCSEELRFEAVKVLV